MIDISVIIPMYNTEKHIRKCIDSLLIQQGAQFEFIIVVYVISLSIPAYNLPL